MMGQLPSSSGNKEGKGSEGVMRQEEGVHKEGEEGEQSSPVPVPIPPSLPKMVWEVGPSKFELPEEARAYKCVGLCVYICRQEDRGRERERGRRD